MYFRQQDKKNEKARKTFEKVSPSKTETTVEKMGNLHSLFLFKKVISAIQFVTPNS